MGPPRYTRVTITAKGRVQQRYYDSWKQDKQNITGLAITIIWQPKDKKLSKKTKRREKKRGEEIKKEEEEVEKKKKKQPIGTDTHMHAIWIRRQLPTANDRTAWL